MFREALRGKAALLDGVFTGEQIMTFLSAILGSFRTFFPVLNPRRFCDQKVGGHPRSGKRNRPGVLLLLAALFWFPAVPVFGQTLLLTLNDPNPQADAFFGRSLAGIGDVNGDTVPDIAAGAQAQDVGSIINQGQVFLFSGATGSLLQTLNLPGTPQTANFGSSLAGVGDVNGDTVPDLAVGAESSDVNTFNNQGQVFVFSGANGNLLLTLNDPIPQPSALFGSSLAGIEDVNGDSVQDIAVGARAQDVDGIFDQGQAFVFSGATGNLLFTLNHPSPPQVFVLFGFPIAGIGDVNGDTVPDLATGAFFQDVSGNFRQGQVFVFSGATGTLLFTLDDPNPQAGAQFSRSLAGIGDVNGDTVPDLAVGAFFQDVGANSDQGQVLVFSLNLNQLPVALAGTDLQV